MKKTSNGLMVLGILLMLTLFLPACFESATEAAPSSGSYDEGFTNGYKEGYNEGYTDGFIAGQNAGGSGGSGGSSGGGTEEEFDGFTEGGGGYSGGGGGESDDHYDGLAGEDSSAVVDDFVKYFKADNESAARGLVASGSPASRDIDDQWNEMKSGNWSGWSATRYRHVADDGLARVTLSAKVSSFLGSRKVNIFVDLKDVGGEWMIYEIKYSAY
ncbi:hypothetical protein K8R78_06545 [bacterium]|nr:hypothetical protein [bacterium]